MTGLDGKLVVTGACYSASLAPMFLDEGAIGVIAPESPVSWENLSSFFQGFYDALAEGQNPSSALERCVSQFYECWSFCLYERSQTAQPLN